jgi:tetratricopeptide (TPR) repeat protein
MVRPIPTLVHGIVSDSVDDRVPLQWHRVVLAVTCTEFTNANTVNANTVNANTVNANTIANGIDRRLWMILLCRKERQKPMYPAGSHLRLGLLALLVVAIVLPTACSRDVQTEPREADPVARPETGHGTGPAAALEPAEPAASSKPKAAGQDQEEEIAKRYKVAREQRQLQAARLVQEGRDFFLRAEYEKALNALRQARYLDRDNQEALELLNRTTAALDQRLGAIQDQGRREELRRRVKLEQARLRADNLVLQGDRARQDGDYETAIEHYSDALNILQHGPYGVDLGMDQSTIENRLRDAREAAKKQARDMERTAKAGVLARKQEQDAREAKRDAERIKRLMHEAYRNFQLARYDEAEKYLNFVLKVAPPESNYQVEAEKLLLTVRDSRHDLKRRDIKRQAAEDWKRIMEDLKLATLPPTSEIEFPRDWADTIGKRQPPTIARTTRALSEEDKIIMRRLESTTVPLSFEDETPFLQVLDYFHKVSAINFIPSKGVHEKLAEGGTLAGINTRLPMKNALELVLDMIGGLSYKVENGLVKIILPEEAKADVYLDFYPVQDLVNPIKDYPGPEINLNPSGFEPEEAMGDEESTNQNFEPDRLVDLIKGNIAKETWEEDPASYSAQHRNGILIVKHTEAVHKQIQKGLAGLRRSANIMVALEARFLLVEDNFLEDIGVDFRGLGDNSQGIGQPGQGTRAGMDDFGAPGSPGGVGTPEAPRGPGTNSSAGIYYNDNSDGDIRARIENLYDSLLGNPKVLTGFGGLSVQVTYLDDTEVELILRAVRKSERINVTTAPRITVFNTERANVTVLNQVSYIKDYDAEIAQAAAITEPVVDVIQDGVVLDVRPIVSADRRYITMDLRPTVAQLTRPIPVATVSVATGTPVTLELPRLEIQRVRTTVTIPDNATVLLGGLKFSEEQKKFSGIPILSHIPILSFFTSRRGTYTSRRNLLILLKAKILIPGEVAPQAGLGD